MKKIFLLLFVSLFVLSCTNNKAEESDNIINNENGTIEDIKEEDNTDKGNGDVNSLTDEEYLSLMVPEDYELKHSDMRHFQKAIEGDDEYFLKEKEEQDFFYLFRDFIYGDNYTDGKLASCIKGEFPIELLTGIEEKICKGENFYIEESNTNFFHIKDSLVKLKEIKEIKDGLEYDCTYFLGDIYSAPKEESFVIKRVDYMNCNSLKYGNKYNVYYEDFMYTKALQYNKCSMLKDNNLLEICNEENEGIIEDIKQ